MSLDESSVLMDRALVTMCQDLPESLGLYNTDKDQFSLEALRSVPLLEHVRPSTRKFVLLRDWMRAFEPGEDQPLHKEITIELLKETIEKERKEREKELQSEEEMQKRVKRDEKKKKKKEKKILEKEILEKKKKKRNCMEEKKTRGRKRRHEVDSDDSEVMIDESSSSSDESSSETSSSSSDSDTTRRVKKRTKTSGNLPPIEMILSSDEDEEPNDMFDTDDPDVYEVEKILRKKKGETYGEQDLYEVKWEGYEETTWEPASNISKDLIDEFEGQPVREDVYTVEEIIDRRNKRDAKTRLKTHQYKVKWVGYDDLTWEPAENLPHNLRRKFDQQYESRKRR
ncbi:hypothetical protein KXD40_005402 [Peronospora effusa]|uniref:Chromo domain-containing protein n=1 Tax=Peronospora effusa TaxID=542832 RepID=A0A3M6VNE8_9STRA|nr:hypothetical protein DD238_000528 [Peronospora effusa]UIZ27487.1 hypothetical protein KXD40_005402 [Peronospora effusa]